ncbi:MAG: hypothetical protein ABIO49_17045, partial [Dokdonella sp.]
IAMTPLHVRDSGILGGARLTSRDLALSVGANQVAQSSGSWLLTLEDANEFALGFGDDPMNIMMHGCSSPDALGEWCA